MNLNGMIFMDGGCWLADIPGLDLTVQGDSKDDAFEQIKYQLDLEIAGLSVEFSWLNQDQGVFTVKFLKPGQVFHEMIKRHRVGCETSLEQLAKSAKKMSVEHWHEIEAGTKQPTTAQFFAMLESLGLDVFISIRKPE